jgi:hypothetical protein
MQFRSFPLNATRPLFLQDIISRLWDAKAFSYRQAAALCSPSLTQCDHASSLNGAAMSYQTIIAFRASAEMRLALGRLAETRETDMGKVMRLLVARELGIVRDPLADLREQVLFAAIGVDGILMHLDPALRAKIVKLWQERVVPGGGHAS